MVDVVAISSRYAALSGHLDERARRIFAATEAKTAGYRSIAAVARATGIAASTIGRGLKELAAAEGLDLGRMRRPGGGKKRVAEDPVLLADLLALVEPDTRDDLMSLLRWTCKSLSQLTRALVTKGHRVGRTLVGDLLHQQKIQSAGQPQDARGRQRWLAKFEQRDKWKICLNSAMVPRHRRADDELPGKGMVVFAGLGLP